ncbi:type II toxin-antitoxin system VapC family toxin [Granulicella paludicola]|uniref:type II toxin-antitoxin system VapC family toxin n=1 Tax=Granulicella paludicola TaxID=474951 RepID=UPI0021E026EC|nr:type II toxin-antitoxin system VapC family toxin [Granulicella paludicola]
MILLDTNVISEPAKPLPDARVMRWIDAQTVESLYVSSTVLAEWLTGVEKLPQGRRRREMEELIHQMLQELIGPRVLSFDRVAAEIHAKLMAEAGAKGVTVSFADCQIAAVAKLHDLTVATRDTGPFLAMGVRVIDPWEA